MIASLRRHVERFADFIGCFQAPVIRLRHGTYVKAVDSDAQVTLPQRNPFIDVEQLREYRSTTALELLDAETFGFMVLLLRRDGDAQPEMVFRCQTDDDWLPAFRASAAQIVAAA